MKSAETLGVSTLRRPSPLVTDKCFCRPRKSLGRVRVPFSELKLAVHVLGPDLSLCLDDAKESRMISSLDFFQRVAERLICIHMRHRHPFRGGAALGRLPLFDREKSVRHMSFDCALLPLAASPCVSQRGMAKPRAAVWRAPQLMQQPANERRRLL